jgi:type II secretory pathway pseudopilin PulG
MNLKKKNQHGFTLIEAIVATFLFTIMMASIMGVYLSTIKLHRRADAVRKATEHARFISESMSKEIRNGVIDWEEPKPLNVASFCGGAPSTNPDYRLSIINVDGNRLCYYLGDDSGFLSASGQVLWLIKNDLGSVRLSSEDVRIKNFRIYVNPLVNPYCNDPPSCSNIGTDVQPRVTIVANIESVSDPKNIVSIPIQTTVNLPIYDFVSNN